MKCIECKTDKEEDQFSLKNKKIGKRNSKCKECCRTYSKQHYLENKARYKQRAQNFNKLAQQRNVKFLWDYKSINPCVDCQNSNPVVLDFDHVRGTKVDNVCTLAYVPVSLKVLIAEVDKCEIRCANCHRIKTDAGK
jgi:hypothetical protein